MRKATKASGSPAASTSPGTGPRHHPHQPPRPAQPDGQAPHSSPASAASSSIRPWIAERAWALELGPAHDTAAGLHNALARIFRSATRAERLGVLTAHPDLAGKLAAAKRLTAESTAEQASRRARRADRCRARHLRRTQRRLCRPPRLPLHHRGARQHQGRDPRRLRAPHRATTATPNSPRPARQVERIAELRLKDMLLR